MFTPSGTRFQAAGDSAVLIHFPDTGPEKATRSVAAAFRALDRSRPNGVLDLVPARASLMVLFDPLLTSSEQIEKALAATADIESAVTNPEPIEIPVLYGGQANNDLADVARTVGISVEEVIELHSSAVYTVYFIGFLPGFPYMGPLPEQLNLPRLDTPRTKVPAGSVAIADDMTGIYPHASPGGWRILGRTPITLFDTHKDKPCLLEPGSGVRFVPVSEHEFGRIREQQPWRWR